MSELNVITSEKIPAAVGPYSAAVEANGMLFISGQLPIDPATGELAAGGIAEKAAQSMRNLGALLEAAGTDYDHVVKTTVFLTDLADFAEVNRVYGAFFKKNYPARSCFQVAALPKGAPVEIEAIAVL